MKATTYVSEFRSKLKDRRAELKAELENIDELLAKTEVKQKVRAKRTINRYTIPAAEMLTNVLKLHPRIELHQIGEEIFKQYGVKVPGGTISAILTIETQGNVHIKRIAPGIYSYVE